MDTTSLLNRRYLVQADKAAAHVEAPMSRDLLEGIATSTLPHPVLAVDTHGVLVTANQAASVLFGIAEDEFGTSWLESRVPLPERASVRADIHKVLEEGRGRLVTNRVRVGDELIRIGWQGFRVESGVPLVVVVGLRLPDDPPDALAVLHDINNFIGAAQGCLELSAPQPGTLQEEALVALSGAVALSRSFLATRKAVATRAELTCAGTRELLTMLPLLRVVARGCSVELIYDQEVQLAGEPYDLIQIIQNLVDNAAKAMRHKGKICITQRVVDATSVDLVVEDDGPGIPPEKLEMLQQVWFSEGKDAGFGLGSSIVRAVARRVGADLTISSAPGQGTQVCLRWPRAL